MQDLINLGLWGARVRCSQGGKSIALGADSNPVEYLEFHYPVTLGIFNLVVEAPVMFTRADGSTVCIGVPSGDLELSGADVVSKTD